MIPIEDIYKFKGSIPAYHDLVIYEEGSNPEENGFFLTGFDEIDLFRAQFKKPIYCFFEH